MKTKKKLPLFRFVLKVSGRRARANGIRETADGEKVLTTKFYNLIMDCNGVRVEKKI